MQANGTAKIIDSINKIVIRHLCNPPVTQLNLVESATCFYANSNQAAKQIKVRVVVLTKGVANYFFNSNRTDCWINSMNNFFLKVLS
jgi:hypothetical protein